jgi:ATP-binding cassette, subfamily B, bacterial PglK
VKKVSTIQKIKSLLLRSDQKKLGLLLIPMTLTAVVNAFGIAFVMPFLMVVSNPGMIHSNSKLNAAYRFFGFTHPMHFLIFLGFVAFFMLLFTDALAAFTTWISARVVSKVRTRIAQSLYETYLDKNYEYHLNFNSATLTSNLFQLTSTFTNGYILQGMQLLTNLISIVAIITLIIVVNPMMALLTTLAFGGAYAVIYRVVKNTLHNGGEMMVRSSEGAYKLASESFGGIKDIKLKGSEKLFKRLLFPKLLAMNDFAALQSMMTTMPRYGLEVVAFGGVILMVVLMMMAGQNVSTIIPLVAVYVYSGYRLMPAMQQLFGSVANIRVARASLDKVYESFVTDSADAIKHDAQSVPAMQFDKQFEIRALTYSYKGYARKVLEDINILVRHNDIVGVIGATGAGKTTLIDIILGLLKPTSGELVVDGEALNTPKKVSAWQQCMGYVPQHIYLSDNSIRDNIAFGEDLSNINQADVENAAKIAAIHDFIVNELPDGYDTMVGERGVKLSGGQMQRVGIARALYRKPSVLVLDEATSSLDGQTEADVMRAIYNMRDKITIIIIAHRLSTVRCCDNIFLMEKGRVIDQDNYDKLMLRHTSLKQAKELLEA